MSLGHQWLELSARGRRGEAGESGDNELHMHVTLSGPYPVGEPLKNLRVWNVSCTLTLPEVLTPSGPGFCWWWLILFVSFCHLTNEGNICLD